MMRFILSVSVAAMGLVLLAVPQTRAAGRAGGGSGPVSNGHMGPSSGEHLHGPGHFDYRFPNRPSHGLKASSRFGYDRYGFRSLYWSNYRWSSDYRCYLYWAPSYRCWFFYEPTFSHYVPVSYYRQVYPEFASAGATAVTPPPSVVQQTTVVVAPPTPAAPVADVVPAAPIPPAIPAPKVVQNTKVGPGAP